MTEKNPHPNRDVATIQNEYQQGCFKAGHIQYQIYALQQDLDTVNKTLLDLNLEGAASKAAKAKEEASEAKQPETPRLEAVATAVVGEDNK